MNIYSLLQSRIVDVAKTLQNTESLDFSRIEATAPKDASHGDIATNAAMVLAAQTKSNPRAIAEALLPALQRLEEVEKAEIAGPGFINLTLKPQVWQQLIPVILREGANYGNSQAGKGISVNVEYVSANPTGPMHVGHGRGAIVGDALASLLAKAGYEVTREYYINDAGGQIDKLADSVFLRYREALGEKISEIPEGLYPGDYLVSAGEELSRIHGNSLLTKPREQWLPLVREHAVKSMLALIKDDLALMGVHHDIFISEAAITRAGKVEEALSALNAKGLIYEGVLEAPKGKTPDDWEPRPQTLFKSTEFGDDQDRAMKKSDGSWTYFAPDVAYHFDKCQRGFNQLVNIFGADHAGYVKRIKAAVAALSDNKVSLDIKLCQLVKFMRGGEPLKMSKRAGTFITVREVVEEVGKGVFRFIMLTRKNDMPLDFDFEKVMEQTRDNPVFYVQYAHARAQSVLRNAEMEFPGIAGKAKTPDMAALARLITPEELALIRLLASWPKLVESASAAHEPHRVAFYLHDLAAAFHSLWNSGNSEIELRFIVKSDIEVTLARVSLALALATVIASGLAVLGVEPVNEMR